MLISIDGLEIEIRIGQPGMAMTDQQLFREIDREPIEAGPRSALPQPSR